MLDIGAFHLWIGTLETISNLSRSPLRQHTIPEVIVFKPSRFHPVDSFQIPVDSRSDSSSQFLSTRSPTSALSHPLFGWEGSPTKIAYRKMLVQTYSNLFTGGPTPFAEKLANTLCFWTPVRGKNKIHVFLVSEKYRGAKFLQVSSMQDSVHPWYEVNPKEDQLQRDQEQPKVSTNSKLVYKENP